MNLTTEIHYIFLLGCLGIAVLATIILYHRISDEFSRWQKRILAVLRGLAAFLISFLLLSPQIKLEKKTDQKPILIIGVDNSFSCVSGNDSSYIQDQLISDLKDLENELSIKYNVEFYQFGEQVALGKKPDFSDQLSDYGAFLTEFEDRYYQQNVGALLFVGDGNFNRGIHPINKLKELNLSTYSFALGDTVRSPDQVIESIRVNPTSFVSAEFPVEVNLEVFNYEGQKAKLKIIQNKKLIDQKEIDIASSDFYCNERFYISSKTKGLQEYVVELEPLTGEKNLKNNRKKFIINVQDNRRKILVLTGGPHPDIGALRRAMNKQSDFEVEVRNIADYKGLLSGVHLVILYQIPRINTSQSKMWKKLVTGRIPYLLITGSQTNWSQLNQLNMGVNTSSVTGLFDMSEASLNDQFGLFEIPSGLNEIIPAWPPLKVPFADFKTNKGLRVLLYQKIKGTQTRKPLLAVGKIRNRKIGILLGEGIWRWRMNEYLRFEDHSRFDQLFTSVIRFLAMRVNEDNFIVHHDHQYASNEIIKLQAEVYDDNFTPLSNAEVSLKIIGENDRTYNYTFDKEGEGYQLNAGKLSAGKYRYKGVASVGEEEWTESGEFVVTEIEIEDLTTMSNHRWMFQVANNTGGEVYFPGQIEQLKKALLRNNKAKQQTMTYVKQASLIHHKILWFLIFIFLSLEWFLRKYWGSY